MHWPRHTYCGRATEYILKTQPLARALGLNDVQGVILMLFSDWECHPLHFLEKFFSTFQLMQPIKCEKLY